VTLAPLISDAVRGVEGKPGLLGAICVAPGCGSPAQQRHHLWARSYLRGQPVEWVEYRGTLIQNTVGLCVRCHQAVTGEIGGHRAHIRWNEKLSLFEWWVPRSNDSPWKDGEPIRDKSWYCVGPLKGQELVPVEPEVAPVRRREGLCPTCGKPKKEHDKKPGPKRKVKTWSISIPDDAEDGAEILDTLIDDFALVLGYGEEPARLKRYHTLIQVLAWAQVNRVTFYDDVEEAANA